MAFFERRKMAAFGAEGTAFHGKTGKCQERTMNFSVKKAGPRRRKKKEC